MTQIQRRRTLLRLSALGTWGGLAWLGAGQARASTATASTTATTNPANPSATACPVIAQETEGPFPADGTALQPPVNESGGPGRPGMPPSGPNRPGQHPPAMTGQTPPAASPAPPPGAPTRAFNVLTLPGIVRSDLRRNLDGSHEAGGVPLTLRLRLVTHSACVPLAGRAIYVWHCSREGEYSVYASGSLADNRLRGVQVTDARGEVAFSTIVPGCYPGRMPHIHFEVYASLAQAVNGRLALATSQLAFPTEAMVQVYEHATGYQASARHLAQISFATDMVFADGVDQQMAHLQGSWAQGFEARLQVAIAA